VSPQRSDHRSANGSARRGDEEVLYRQHHEALVRMVCSRLRVSHEVAEDAVSFAWMQLVRTQPRRENVVGWLYTVAKYEVFATMRRAQREVTVEELPPMAAPGSVERIVEARETMVSLRGLKSHQRLVLIMKAEGFSYNEIAALTGKTYTWVNRHLTEGRKAARRLEAK
jgi:RNA polymerase sigma factor (sigma-70 family)